MPFINEEAYYMFSVFTKILKHDTTSVSIRFSKFSSKIEGASKGQPIAET